MSDNFSMLSVLWSGSVCALYLEQVIVRIVFIVYEVLCCHVPIVVHRSGSKDNSLQAVELSGHQTCKLLTSHPFKPFPRRFSGSESVCNG